jgi:hypothetical protein
VNELEGIQNNNQKGKGQVKVVAGSNMGWVEGKEGGRALEFCVKGKQSGDIFVCKSGIFAHHSTNLS